MNERILARMPERAQRRVRQWLQRASATMARPVETVSVVTVCLNARDTIRLTMESVRQQRGPRMDHVVIDGGSTDGTCEIVREYATGHFVSEKDKGIYDAMDKGARAARGDIVIFLNAGDTFYDDGVADRVARFFDDTGAGIVFGNLLPVYLDATDTHDHGAFQSGVTLNLGYVRNRRQLFDESIHHQATFYRREVLANSYYRSDDPRATGEYNLLLDAVMGRGQRVKHIPETVSRFVLGGLSTGNFEREWEKYRTARDLLRARYFPAGREVPIDSSDEFVHAPRAAAVTTLERRIRAKARLKESSAFRAYDRLARGLSTRTSNQVAEQLTLHQAALEARFDRQAAASHRQFEDRLDRLEDLIQNRFAEVADERRTTMGELRAEVASLRRQLNGSESVGHGIRADVGNALAMLADVRGAITPDGEDFGRHGFRVSSQWDEDGLIQYLIRRCAIDTPTFVEFGVGDYSEACTRFLLEHNRWSGMIMDSDPASMKAVRESALYWRHSLKAVTAYITRESINGLLRNNGVEGEIGLLCVDIDGMDYWVWEAIDAVTPQLVICEYNGLFGPDAAVTVPYQPDFDRRKGHFSWLYAGASLMALKQLGERKGYTLIGTASGGNNAFFVRNDLVSRSGIRPAEKLFTAPLFREARHRDGSLSYLDVAQGRQLIAGLPLVDVLTGRTTTVGAACISAAGTRSNGD